MTPRFDTAMRWLLIASLALNVGLLSGVAWHYLQRADGKPHRTHMAMARGTMMPSPMLLRRVLPEERHGVADAVMARHRASIRASIGNVIQARARVHETLAADVLDRRALEQAFAGLRARDVQAATAVQAMLTELMVELTPAERRAVAEAMKRRHPQLRRGGAPDRSRGESRGNTPRRDDVRHAPGHAPG